MELDKNGLVKWIVDPAEFAKTNLEQILSSYGRNIEMAGYDPQVVGKNKARENLFKICLGKLSRINNPLYKPVFI